VVVADAGYWHKRQMENVVSRGIQVLIPPDSGLRQSARPGWDGGLYAFMRRVLSTDHAKALYRKRHATIEPVFGQMKFNRRFDRFLRRGRSAVRSEWRLFGASHNLLKLPTTTGQLPPRPNTGPRDRPSRPSNRAGARRTAHGARDFSCLFPTASDEGSILLPPDEQRSTADIQSINETAGATQRRGLLGTAGWLPGRRVSPICRDF
jgi:hypothetical protein